MKQLITSSLNILGQLEAVFGSIGHSDFSRPVKALGGATLGQHLRHTIEFFICLEDGFHNGTVNYDKRAHDRRIETDRSVALLAIRSIRRFVTMNDLDKRLALEFCYDVNGQTTERVETNYSRELAYNIEHAIHHMAIMKIGLREIDPGLALPAHFGVASSTIRHQSAVLASA